MRNLNMKLWTALTGLAAAAALTTGCDDTLDEDPVSCSLETPCADGFTCEIPTDETEGVCEAVEPVACADDSPCADGFACTMETDATAGVCETSCSDTLACADGYMCNDGGACEMPPEYTYVVIQSETSAEGDLNNNTPGPDIDAVALVHEGVESFATEVLAFGQGAGGDDDGLNANADSSKIVGTNDAIPGGDEDCSLAEDPDGLFWSMGDMTGFAIVRFEGVIADGDTIRVYELDSECPNVETERADIYGVSIGLETIDPTTIAAASDITGWMSLGSSAATGGVHDFTVVLPTE